MSETHLTNQKFVDLPLPEAVLAGLRDAGLEYCTPIQAQTLPAALAGRDVLGQAQTGTGKTAAFLLAVFDRLLTLPPPEGYHAQQPRAVVLAPTRELALQIHRDAEQIGAHTGLRCAAIYGGTGYESQRRTLEEGTDLLVGTPGRIIDYFKQKVFDFKAVQTVVLDEADQMFDLGFLKDIRYLLRRMPPPSQRLGLLFSATLSLRVEELAYEHMRDPLVVRVEPEQVTAAKVQQVVYCPAGNEKLPLLLGLLQRDQPERAIIFINTRHEAASVANALEHNGYTVAQLSGDVPQKKRQQLLKQFHDGKARLLVATDVAARGLHIPDVEQVYNYDLPQDPEDYVHRIGRTARLGAKGEAISFACEKYAYHLPDIEAYIGDRLPMEAPTPELLVAPKPGQKRRRRSGPPRSGAPRGGPSRGGPRRGKPGGNRRPRKPE